MKNLPVILAALFILLSSCGKNDPVAFKSFSGIYPHLAYYNNEDECGTGAVVPWAGKLWVITYGPHLPHGSSDKLYEISPRLTRITRPESVGGTPANRMIHRESNQLFIGPYVIDSLGNVRVIPPEIMPGRLTGNARHLTDPQTKIYYLTMEEGLYEVGVNSLSVSCIYRDGNVKEGDTSESASGYPFDLLPGTHGKGAYSGQGVLLYSNNGEASGLASTKFDIESGSLNEWNGSQWKLIRRNQFVEVTGPGGIYGNSKASDPLWVTGFDHKSLLLGVRDNAGWSFFRLPKASHSYDGAHGWNTEWPRIRDVGTKERPFYLMTLHGMFWHFPVAFTSYSSAGIRPISSYLKVIGDFCMWNDSIVLGCDDSAKREFLNKRKAKGGIEGPGQSNSNLWFASLSTLRNLGPATAEGSAWLSEDVRSGEYSEPFLFAGWDNRIAWVLNEGKQAVELTFEVDAGNGNWTAIKTIAVSTGGSANLAFDNNQKGEWIRLSSSAESKLTVHFWYEDNDTRSAGPGGIFSGFASADESQSSSGLLRSLGENSRKLGFLAGNSSDNSFNETGYYELDSLMNLSKVDKPAAALMIREKVAIPDNSVVIDSASVLVIDDKGRRWRLPKGNERFTKLSERALLRICREVATERDLFSCAGTFYELPAENADGFAKIRPVSSHNFRIHDYASWRGLLVMTGISIEYGGGNDRIIRSADGKAALWAGTIDDLWKMGKPFGNGGPWYNTPVYAGMPSDPYLIGFYDKRTLSLSHNSPDNVTFTIEADPVGTGKWMQYGKVIVPAGKTYNTVLPLSFRARWIRFVSGNDCIATAKLKYE